MEIYPAKQLAMLLSAFSLGFCMGGVWELIAAARILLGVYLPPESMRARYESPLPFLKRGVPWPSKGRGRVRRALTVAIGDLHFCLLFALGVILLLYYYNDGAIRPLALLCAFLGLGAFRVTLARVCPYLTARLAYLLAVLRAYVRAMLRLPVRLLAVLGRLLARPVCALWRRVRRWRLHRASAALCRAQLALAQRGLCPAGAQKKKEGGSAPCNQKEKRPRRSG
jgi:hypothetical protein